MKIVFAGTPVFSDSILIALLNAISTHPSWSLQCVLTQPDRPAGRGQHLHMSPVKLTALEKQIPIMQPITLKSGETAERLAALLPDVLITAAYGLLIPKSILMIPKLGCLNVHTSLLPRLRGASPVQHAILAGDTTTGITIMQMDEGMDTGDILESVSCPISPSDTSETLENKLAQLGANALIEVLEKLETNPAAIITQKQDSSFATHCSKIQKKSADINWSLSAIQIERAVRAYQPWPIAYSHLSGQLIRIWEVLIHAPHSSPTQPPGSILEIKKDRVIINTGEGQIALMKAQLPGKKPLPMLAILNGHAHLFQAGNQFLQSPAI